MSKGMYVERYHLVCIRGLPYLYIFKRDPLNVKQRDKERKKERDKEKNKRCASIS